jgi:hypothetical protein
MPSKEEEDRRKTIVGLAKYKASQGNISGAKAIADQHNIPYAEIGLEEEEPVQLMSA